MASSIVINNPYQHLTTCEQINKELTRLSNQVEKDIHDLESQKAYHFLRIYEFNVVVLAKRHAEILGIDFDWEDTQ